MARRVERTTGLPRPRPKERRDSARTFAGITWTDRRRDLTILGVAVAFAVLVGGMLLFQFYDNTVLQPRSTVLRVGDEVVVTVADDGKGIAGEVVGGHGLVNLRERAAGLGGSVDLLPGERCGTELRWAVPAGACADA